MYTIYVIQSLPHSFLYVGMTGNLNRRLQQHNQRKVRSTRPYAPFRLVYTETCATRAEARHREKYLKSTAGKNYLRNRIDEVKYYL